MFVRVESRGHSRRHRHHSNISTSPALDGFRDRFSDLSLVSTTASSVTRGSIEHTSFTDITGFSDTSEGHSHSLPLRQCCPVSNQWSSPNPVSVRQQQASLAALAAAGLEPGQVPLDSYDFMLSTSPSSASNQDSCAGPDLKTLMLVCVPSSTPSSRRSTMDETLTTQQHVEDIPRPVDRDAVLLKKDKKKRGPREARQSVVPRGKTKRKDSVQYNVKEEGTYVANDQHPIHPAVTQTDPYFPSVSEQRLTHPYPTSLDEDDLYDHHAPPSQEYGGGQYMEATMPKRPIRSWRMAAIISVPMTGICVMFDGGNSSFVVKVSFLTPLNGMANRYANVSDLPIGKFCPAFATQPP
ncbi:hypothetical protein B0T24DRAFT_48907 [Lasiosphaeria ovina]|uniref:Uncharacterized protein n=1 Tax=Lasiosphaeria ovina TaxID=92902 RepID=A0AAE0TXP6_9PEZI|nr:hypothetical protein B0T24DRAFT_48907 [Lasiosphaeria ovina]